MAASKRSVSRAPSPQACRPISRLPTTRACQTSRPSAASTTISKPSSPVVPGAAHNSRPAAEDGFASRVIRQAADVGVDVRQQGFQGARALHGQHERLRRHIVDGDVEPAAMLGNQSTIFSRFEALTNEEINDSNR